MMTTCHDFTCGNHGGGSPFDAAKHCRKCWAAANHPAVAASLKRPLVFPPASPAPQVAPRSHEQPLKPPCRWEGNIVSACQSCQAERGHERQCLHPEPDDDRDLCTRGATNKTLRRCNACPQYESREPVAKPAPPPPPAPPRVDALPPLRRTVVNLPGHFNGSILTHGGGLLLATRRQQHTLHLSRLGDDFQPEWTRPLVVGHPAAHGTDDPRLFCHGGRLHVGFVAISAIGATASSVRIRQGVAVLSDNYDATEPRVFDHGGRIEKNWGWFDHDGELHAVYSISPHRVLRVGDAASVAHDTPNLFPWSGGYLRGGAPPVRIGDEYWVWFHGADEGRKLRTYNVGVYAFEEKPPFRVTRMSPAPLLWAKPSERTSNGGADVVFPAGAIHRDGKWIISMGVADEHTEIAEWNHADVEAMCKRT